MWINRPAITRVTTLTHASDQQIADFFHLRLVRAIKKADGPIAIALPGGSTPAPILKLMLEQPLEWANVTVFPTDDREVAEDHAASNTGALRSLLEPHGATITPLAQGMAVPHFALVWLGMGADGHIASLFPSSQPDPDAPDSVIRITPDPLPPEAPFARITLTIPALLDCDEMAFVARGQKKREVFDAALKGKHDLPVRRLLAAREAGFQMPVTCFY
jgi:6-phosphogluconolactonase